MDDSQRRHWEIRTNLGRHVHPSGDGSGWLWEVSRDDQVARVMIEISEAAWSADPVGLPEETRRALETDGRTELLEVLATTTHRVSSDAARPGVRIARPRVAVEGRPTSEQRSPRAGDSVTSSLPFPDRHIDGDQGT